MVGDGSSGAPGHGPMVLAVAGPIVVAVIHRLTTVGVLNVPILSLVAATVAVLTVVGLAATRRGFDAGRIGFALAVGFWVSGLVSFWTRWSPGMLVVVAAALLGGVVGYRVRDGVVRWAALTLLLFSGILPVLRPGTVDPAPITLGPVTENRDLIVIMIDAYPSSDALRLDHGYDNAEFRSKLEDRGFTLPPEPWANSSHASTSVATSLSGEYLFPPNSPPNGNYNQRDRHRLMSMIDNNPVSDLLAANGFTTTTIGGRSPIATWFRLPATNSLKHVARTIDAAVGNDEPDFVFAHPTGCGDAPTKHESLAAAAEEEASSAIVERTQCINRVLTEAFEAFDGALGSTDDGDAVVVVAGANGATTTNLDGDSDVWGRIAIRERLGVFAAIRLEPGCRPPAGDATVAVIVHHAVACALGAAPDPPPERAFVVDGDPLDPAGALDVNLDVLRSDLSGSGTRTSQ